MNNSIQQITIAILLIVMLSPSEGSCGSLNANIREGVSSYEKQQYEKASQLFQDAYTKQPDNGQLAYNQANSDYKSGKFDKALGAYSKAMTADLTLKQKSLYNSGNALSRMGKLEEAAAAYKKSLELDSKDLDAKFNLEFVREQIKKQKQQQDKQNQNSDKQQKQDRQDQSKQQEKSEGQDQQQSKDSDQNKQQQETKNNKDNNQSRKDRQDAKQDKPKPSDDKNAQSPMKAEMSKEEADQWLRSLVENPKKFTQKQIQEQLKQANEPVGNDW